MTAKKKSKATLRNPKPPKSSRLTVLWKVENCVYGNGRQFSQYLCQCSCGETVKVERSKIQSGHKRSCGCLLRDTIREIGNASRVKKQNERRLANAK